MLNGIRRSAVALSALVPLAAPLAAQVVAQPAGVRCGAGVAFGVTSYQCSNCSIAYKRDGGEQTTYSFGAELVVLKVAEGSQLRVGDVIVAVNGNPITTRAGADQFVYPAAGSKTLITVRRDGVNVDVGPIAPLETRCESTYYDFTVTKPASGKVTFDTVAMNSVVPAGAGRRGRDWVGTGSGAGRGRGVGSVTFQPPVAASTSDSSGMRRNIACTTVSTPRPPADAWIDSARFPAAFLKCLQDSSKRTRLTISSRSIPLVRSATTNTYASSGGTTAAASTPASAEATSDLVPLTNFGLTLACATPCTRARASDGTQYWKFDGYPALSIGAKDGLAAKAGLRDGDVLIAVNGFSPLTEEGALLLARYSRELTLTLEISRAGKRDKFTLKL